MADENKNQVEETTEEIEETKEKKVENKEPEKKYSDEQVDEIIKEKKAKWQKQQDEKIKELEEARRLEKMNEDEKLKYQSAMAKVAKNMLIEQGFNISDDLVNNLITDEAETTKENVKDFAGMLKDLVEKEVNERLKGKSPEVKKTGVKSSQSQRSEILGIKDAVKRREAMLNHPELFN